MFAVTCRAFAAAETLTPPHTVTRKLPKTFHKPGPSNNQIKQNCQIVKKALCHSHVDEFTLKVVRPYLLEILDWCDSLQFFKVNNRDALHVRENKMDRKLMEQIEQLPGSRGFPLFVLARYEKTAKALHLETTNAHTILSVLGTQWNLLPEDVLLKINFGSVGKVLKQLREL
ncbi:hypothetical protein XU18_4149 [Perkinsela sp. CCAP 1560/4]|nr:hypothetical protein XU18_4149 [Perkinsela sp. CCAP 1560/4]|eukprot:KNH04661.1 hypothetical protein XU18_4149 [Perkinsela sp. CCAP 1560/4]